MVQIKKKVTLKVKTVQEPIKEPEPNASPTPNGGDGNGKGSSSKVLGGIAAVVVACLLFYGAYCYFSSSDEQNDSSTAEQVERSTGISNEEGVKEVSNTQTAETDYSNNYESVNDEGVSTPEQDVYTPTVSSHQSRKKQGGVTKPAESSQVTTLASQAATLSSSLEEKAKEVIRGDYGNGEVRKQKLGDQYWDIQKKVNEIYQQKGLL